MPKAHKIAYENFFDCRTLKKYFDDILKVVDKSFFLFIL